MTTEWVIATFTAHSLSKAWFEILTRPQIFAGLNAHSLFSKIKSQLAQSIAVEEKYLPALSKIQKTFDLMGPHAH